MNKDLIRIHLDTVDSTNNYLYHLKGGAEHRITLVTATEQTGGRGQRGNSWESEPGRNLVFSLLLHPRFLSPLNVFALSEAIALSICQAVEPLLTTTGDGSHPNRVTVKWPNDIYVGDCKLCGILIENTLYGSSIGNSIVGIGLNINQRHFVSDAPNPVSMALLCNHDFDTEEVLDKVLDRIDQNYRALENGENDAIHQLYMQHLYRGSGLHAYQDQTGTFDASIDDVEPSGHLVLRLADGGTRRYAFKEVSYIIP